MQDPLASQQLDRYFSRIRYRGPREATLGTLRALHRAHLMVIPFENLDVHFGVPITLDPEAMFTKLVDERRGGWCFEMNGVFGRVLETLGFDVRYVSAAVGRDTRGWRAQGNHLALVVRLDRSWIADVGFGDGFLAPLPLEPGTYTQGFLGYRVSRDGPRWRVDGHEFGGADGFDFTLTPRTLDDFRTQCRELQTSPDSGFVKSIVCARFMATGFVILRGAVLREVTGTGVATTILRDGVELERTLRERFDLTVPGIEELWPSVSMRHAEWESEQHARVAEPASRRRG